MGFLWVPKKSPYCWCEEILNQLRLVVYPVVYRDLYTRGQDVFRQQYLEEPGWTGNCSKLATETACLVID